MTASAAEGPYARAGRRTALVRDDAAPALTPPVSAAQHVDAAQTLSNLPPLQTQIRGSHLVIAGMSDRSPVTFLPT